MNFLVNLFNHNEVGQRSLEDVVGIIGKQLIALGHQVVWDPKNALWLPAQHGYNVIVEGFTKWTTQMIRTGYEQGARFIIIATEEPTPKGFNHGTQAEMVQRQHEFEHAAKYASAIIHLVPGEHVRAWYGQFAPTAYTELGHAPSLERVDKSVKPEFDFGFFGSMTPRRVKLLRKLMRACNSPKGVHAIGDFQTQNERDREMRRAKVVVQIRKFDAMGLVSSSRCNTSLCIGRPIVAEPHMLAHPWDKIVTFAKTDAGFVDLALMVKATWEGTHAAQLDRLRKMLPPQECIGKALIETGILPPIVSGPVMAKFEQAVIPCPAE